MNLIFKILIHCCLLLTIANSQSLLFDMDHLKNFSNISTFYTHPILEDKSFGNDVFQQELALFSGTFTILKALKVLCRVKDSNPHS